MTTSSPVSRRTPAPSEPGTSGSGKTYAGPGGVRTRRARRLTAAARSSTRTSPGPATGSSTCRNESSPPSRTRIACTRATLRARGLLQGLDELEFRAVSRLPLDLGDRLDLDRRQDRAGLLDHRPQRLADDCGCVRDRSLTQHDAHAQARLAVEDLVLENVR